MATNYNSKRYRTPSVYTQLIESREAHGKTQEALQKMMADRDYWKALAEQKVEDNG